MQHLAVEGLPADAPLKVAAAHDGGALRVTVELAADWHLYARDVGGGQPVTIAIDGGAFAAAGALVVPERADGLITGVAELRLPLRRTSAGDALMATMRFAVCDALQCLPPMELRLATPCTVLLVAVDGGERAQRIATFLREGGFVPTLTTWGTVTAEECEAHDVVLADSPLFDELGGVKSGGRSLSQCAASFPATNTPIVAVGFLGTKLLVGQKVTMACGYI